MIYACILMLIMFQVKPERHLPQVDSLATKPQHFQAGHRPTGAQDSSAQWRDPSPQTFHNKIQYTWFLKILKHISQWEGFSHILCKIKNVWNHQPENVRLRWRSI